MRKYVSQFLLICFLLFVACGLMWADVLIGDQNVESMLDSNAAGRAQAFQALANTSGVVSSLTLYVDPTSTASQIAIGLYSDSGGHPSSLLTQASFTPQAGTWNTVSVPATAVVAGAQYWIAVLGLGSGRPYFRDTPSPCTSEGSTSSTLTTLPTVWSTGGIWAACALSAYGSSDGSGSVAVAVAVAPASATLPAGGTQQFSATVTGTSNTAVTWSATGGSISSSGLYTASSAAGIYTVKATSVADTTKFGLAMVSISALTASSASLWTPGTLPGTVDSGDGNPVELGVEFTSSTTGAITGLRFYKSSNNTGTHVGNLWTSSGALLASATFTNESASGWQTVNFVQPVAIQANTTYVASYHTNVGHYSDDINYFAAPYSAPPLGTPASSGVYVYGASSAFPTQTWNASNYWVDIILQYGSTTPPSVGISLTPTSASLTTGGTQQFTAAVTGSTNTGVAWSASGGTVSSAGLYTAPATAGTYSVTATSMADTTKSASATVTITTPTMVAVSISPTSASLRAGGTQQFTATVAGTTNTAVTWSASGGTISTGGLYTAPSGAGIYTVNVTSAADASKSASSTVTVAASAAHSVTLNWIASASSVVGYNVYRATQSGGPYTLINPALQSGTSYADLSVQAGQTYYYVVTAVNGGTESAFSNQATAAVPSP